MTLQEDLLSAVESVDTASVDRLTFRKCDSDRFSGVEVKIYGNIVHTRPIIDYIAEQDNLGIEEMYHNAEGDEPCLVVFIAYIEQQPHPAFV